MEQTKESTRSQLDEVIGKSVSLIDFNASWCAPCRAQKPIIDHLAEAYRDRVTVAELDVDENRETAMQLGITSIPTLILYKENREVERFVGLQTIETLSTAIENVLQPPL